MTIGKGCNKVNQRKDKMDFFEASRTRCSYRGAFTDEPVPREDLIKIVQAGLEAPSGCNKQTTGFVIVDSPRTIEKIQAIPGGNKALSGGRAYILCTVDKNPEPAFEDMSFQVEDCAAAVENILLAITALGYGGVWIDGWLRREGRAESLAKLVNLPEGKTIRVIIPLGRPAETPPSKEKLPFDSRVTFA